ncbi:MULTISPECIES: uracil phosphoribosyltransferase [Geothrix]|uniref:uracil phosphoribosyltransferase n=1 Tax=Geothrix TaxID=44675 RepID=UPI001FADCDF9|nr:MULTISPECIES: uracil phosphoribosyltransferase [Geothrix]HJV38472.1 uracil phosphoribosyltransferase [Geothrix sp.]
MTIHVLDHPLVHHKLSLIRDRKTPGILFRSLIEEVGLILATESTRSLPVESMVVETPLERTSTLRLKSLDPVLVPVLRAGLGLLPSFLKLLPTAKVGHLGLYRDHDSLVPVPYYRNFPPLLEDRPVFVLDPMLATGGSASEAVRQLKGAGAVNLSLVALLAAPEGLERLNADHPDLTIVVAAVDRQLNEKGYILPGLGDAGDRLFGTA